MDVIYQFLRGGSGFSLVVAGLSLLLAPNSQPVFRHFGRLFLCAGALFTLSVLSDSLPLPEDIGDFWVFLLIYVLSQSLFEVALFVFGGERHVGWARRVWVVGAVWSAGMWGLQFLDYLLDWGHKTNLEEGRSLGLFHNIGDVTVYLWPMVILVASLTMTRWGLRDLPGRSRAIRPLIVGLGLILGCLSLVVVAMAVDSLPLYRFGHTLLEFLILLWYFFVVRRPEALVQMRKAIEAQSLRRTAVSSSETEIIGERLRVLVESHQIYRDHRLSLPFLAKRIQLPAYQLSRYFNQVLQCRFSDWLNRLRVDDVCRELTLRPSARILDLAQEAGYASKAVFNAQFRRILGVSPSQYRKRLP
jgi:AraC-like DNA-binding protein